MPLDAEQERQTMPEESGSQQIGWQPHTQAPVQPPPQPPSNQSPPNPPGGDDPEGDKATAKKLEDIAKGERWLIGIGIAGVLVNLLLGSIYYQQLTQMRVATEASRQAVQLAHDTLDYNASQFDRAMRQTINQTSSQYRATQESIVSARAAQSAAQTAIDTLHIAQRAYISTGTPSMNFTAGTIHIPLINSGHIPSGLIQIKTFEVTADVRDPSNIRDGTVIEKHWMPSTKQAFQIGQGIGFEFPIRMATAEKVAAGTQYFIIAGNITYNDGFPDTPPQHWDFCFQTVYNPKSKTDIVGICESSIEIPKLMKIIEYPNNEDHPDP